MTIDFSKATHEEVRMMRDLFLRERNFQLRFHANHERGWADYYLISHQDLTIGYGALKGDSPGDPRDRLFEFFLMPTYKNRAEDIFKDLLVSCNARYLQWQTNDDSIHQPATLYSTAQQAEALLFGAGVETTLPSNGTIFRERKDGDLIFDHTSEPVGKYVLENNSEIVATGGFLTHYNFPYVDLFMEVSPGWRKRGLGSYLIQEIKNACFVEGRIPAARCNPDNLASKKTLEKAGMIQVGEVRLARVHISQFAGYQGKWKNPTL